MRQYAKHWDEFSKVYNAKVAHLGDEWGSATPIADAFIAPFIRDGDHVLEIGCGGGKYTEKLIQAAGYKNVEVADCSEEMLRRVRERFKETPVVEHLTDGKTVDAIKSDRPFDAIWSYDVFTHIDLYDIINILLRLRTISKKGAIFVIHHSDLTTAFGYEHWTGLRAMFKGDDSAGSFSVNTAKLMHGVLRYHGFEVAVQQEVRAGRDTVTIFRS